MIEGIRLAATRADVGLPDLDAILHGTTVATNAVLERRGALVGLIVTRGFRHILHLAEAWTPGPLFGFMVYEKPEPLTDTRYVREVPERIGADGAIVEPIDEAAVREAVEELVADGVEALTVCLLNAHANGRHERVIAEIAASVAPDLPVSISSEILPEFREYERTVTTLMNAYVAPVLEKYLTNVRDGLAAARRPGAAPGRALRRRADEPRVGVQERRADGPLGPGRRRQRRVVRRAPTRGSTAS